jgi:hypothetical protein
VEQLNRNPRLANTGPSLRLELQQLPPRAIAPEAPGATGAASASDPKAHATIGHAAPTSTKSVCRHCRRPITRWLDAEFWIGKPGQQIWTHDDLVDGTEDGHCDGISCKNETEDQDATEAEPAFPLSWYRPRFLVLPTGRTIFAWGIWDTQKNPGPIPNRTFKMSEFLHRTRSLGKAYAFARRLNAKHEQKVAA